MRIVTYNFLHGGSMNRCGHWSRLVRTFSPDLILAQECRTPLDSPGEQFRQSNDDFLQWQAAGTRRWGSALYVRAAQMRCLAISDFDGWIVGGEIRNERWSDRAIRIFSIHGPVGEHGYIRTMQQILDRLASQRHDADLILGGDFNIVVGRRPRSIIDDFEHCSSRHSGTVDAYP